MTNTDKKIMWKAGDQACAVVIQVDGKCYQVALDDRQINSLLFFLPQLFDNHEVKIIQEPLESIKLEVKKDK